MNTHCILDFLLMIKKVLLPLCDYKIYLNITFNSGFGMQQVMSNRMMNNLSNLSLDDNDEPRDDSSIPYPREGIMYNDDLSSNIFPGDRDFDGLGLSNHNYTLPNYNFDNDNGEERRLHEREGSLPHRRGSDNSLNSLTQMSPEAGPTPYDSNGFENGVFDYMDGNDGGFDEQGGMDDEDRRNHDMNNSQYIRPSLDSILAAYNEKNVNMNNSFSKNMSDGESLANTTLDTSLDYNGNRGHRASISTIDSSVDNFMHGNRAPGQRSSLSSSRRGSSNSISQIHHATPRGSISSVISQADSEFSSSSGRTSRSGSNFNLQQFLPQSQSDRTLRTSQPGPRSQYPSTVAKTQRDKSNRRKSFSEYSYSQVYI